MAKVGFIGLGTMGMPMARNLVKGGHAVRAFDVDTAAVERIARDGAAAASNAGHAAADADYVITMLPNAPHVHSALFDEGGAAALMRKDALFIDMSTIHPFESDRIAARLNEMGLRMVDAPVGRTSAQAASGKLLILAGGRAEDIEHAKDVFSLLGDATLHCGPGGSGSRAKLVNNYMATALNVLSAETLCLADALGLETGLMLKVLMNTTAGQGHFATTYPTKVLKGDLVPGFMVDLAHKDLGLGLDVASSLRVPMAVGASAREVYSIARAQGLGRSDWTVIYRVLKSLGPG